MGPEPSVPFIAASFRCGLFIAAGSLVGGVALVMEPPGVNGVLVGCATAADKPAASIKALKNLA